MVLSPSPGSWAGNEPDFKMNGQMGSGKIIGGVSSFRLEYGVV